MLALDYEIFIFLRSTQGPFSFNARLQNVSQKLENVIPLSNLHICMHALIGIPYVLLQTLVCGTIVYAMVGSECSVTKFFLVHIFVFFTSLYFYPTWYDDTSNDPKPKRCIIPYSSGIIDL
jgi:hypothetical protein